MRIKRYHHLLQIKITNLHRQKLQQASDRTGVNMSELARLSMRLGLPKLLQELPEQPEPIAEVHHE